MKPPAHRSFSDSILRAARQAPPTPVLLIETPRLKEIAQKNTDLVRSALPQRGEAPTLDETFTVEDPEHEIRIAHVNR